jgi:V/A-type H+-transporting ATPase subunit E
MKGMETGKDKIARICDALKKETLEPAKQEVRELIENAHLQAAEIVNEAKKKAAHILEVSEREMQEKKKVFDASLNLACRQGIEQLKQKIEKELFNQQLAEVVSKEMSDPNVIASIINSLITKMEEKGVEEEFVAVIPKGISPRSISALLAAKVIERLKEKSIEVGEFNGGVQLKLKGSQITLDVSEPVVRELIAQYIRRDLRDLVFNV